MTLIERTAYPRLGRNPSAPERVRLYNLSLQELDLAKRTTRGGEGQQLAFLVMLKSFQCLGYFPNPEDVPEALVSHLRSRLGLADDTPAVPFVGVEYDLERAMEGVRGSALPDGFADRLRVGRTPKPVEVP